jgi:hypothetical protein
LIPETPIDVASIRLVGRDTELAQLAGAYRTVGPDGRLLVLVGEAGIG